MLPGKQKSWIAISSILCTAGCLLAAPPLALGQDTTATHQKPRIRIQEGAQTTNTQHLTGLYVGSDLECVRMIPDGDTQVLSVPASAITAMWVMKSSSKAKAGAGIGALVGLALGGAVSLAADAPKGWYPVPQWAIAIPPAIGLVGGAIIGGAIGYKTRTSRWGPVTLANLQRGITTEVLPGRVRVSYGFVLGEYSASDLDEFDGGTNYDVSKIYHADLIYRMKPEMSLGLAVAGGEPAGRGLLRGLSVITVSQLTMWEWHRRVVFTAGGGPALQFTDYGGHHKNPGASARIGLELPLGALTTSAMLQYNWIWTPEIEAKALHGRSTDSVNFSYGYFAIGLGLRL
jgi:hypothetical protein